MPYSRAAAATAWAWLPAEAHTTPRARPSGPSAASFAAAPRTLKEPLRWRFSAFRATTPPARSEIVREDSTGVRRASASTAGRAASTSSAVTSERAGEAIGSVRQREDRVHLDLGAERQRCDADRRARGRFGWEVAPVRLVDVAEDRDVGDVDRHAHGVLERRAGRGRDHGEVVEATPRLVADRALDELPGVRVDRRLAGEEDETAGLHGVRVGTCGLR